MSFHVGVTIPQSARHVQGGNSRRPPRRRRKRTEGKPDATPFPCDKLIERSALKQCSAGHAKSVSLLRRETRRELQLREPRIKSALGNQTVMRAGGHNPTRVKHDDTVSLFDCRQPMRHHQCRAPL